MVLAALLNGASFYLKRTGLIEPEGYRAYWTAHCGSLAGRVSADEPGPRCCAAALADPAIGAPPADAERRMTRYLYRADGAEVAFKLAKDALLVATLLLGVLLMARGASPFPAAASGWPLHLLFGYLLLAGAAAMIGGQFIQAAAGSRAFLFLAIALTGAWLAPHIAVLAGSLGVLVVLEALLVPYEIHAGMHVYGHFGALPYAGRAAGSLVLPNSLGAFAAVALAFYAAFAAAPRLRLIGAASLVLVLASGSGTGLACTALFWFLVLLERARPGMRLRIAGLGMLAALVLAIALPHLAGRPRLYDSLVGEGGRVQTLQAAIADHSLAAGLFGRGLGTNTNTALNLDQAGTGAAVPARPADSTVTGLLIQVGALGTLLFYLMLAWAAYRDTRARKFYAVLAAASIALNVTELFPLNYLLGIALAHSALAGRPGAGGAP